MARQNTNNGVDDDRKRKLRFVMGTVIVVAFLIRSFAPEIRAITDDVRRRNPQARFLTTVPIMVSVALSLSTFGILFGIVLGAYLASNMRRHEAGYPGRLLWYGFALNFVAMAMTILSYVLILYSSFTS